MKWFYITEAFKIVAVVAMMLLIRNADAGEPVSSKQYCIGAAQDNRVKPRNIHAGGRRLWCDKYIIIKKRVGA